MNQGIIKSQLKSFVPKPLYPLARKLYRFFSITMYFKCIDAKDFIFGRTYEGKKLPPATLRYQVQMSPNGKTFAKIGRRVSKSLIEALKDAKKNKESISDILDFGCGCGRTLIWIKDMLPNATIYGTDTDKSVIDWCEKNLTFGTFSKNNPKPPLEYADGLFDVVYAISVFTHFSEEFQMLWLKELQRIARPEAIILLSLLGPDSWDDVPEPYLEVAKRQGFVYIDPKGEGVLPDWRHVTLHSQKYVEQTFSKYFKIRKYIPKGINNHQDLVVLQKC